MNPDLQRIRAIADYQFGYNAGNALFPDTIRIEYSRKTKRIRHIFNEETLLANYRPNDALFTLTMAGAVDLVSKFDDFDYYVVVNDEVIEFVEQGKNLFAKHVVDAGHKIRPGQEVAVIDSEKNVIAVGKAQLTRDEMLAFKYGVAVKVRRGRTRHR